MKARKSRFLVLAGLVLGSMACDKRAAADQGPTWVTNFEDAKAQAQKDGKDLLLDFTGSDWCPPCMALHEHVLTSDKFKALVDGKFILVVVDFPQSKELPDATRKQNARLGVDFENEGFPTVVLLDSQGHAYWQQVGYGGEPDKYLEKLGEAAKVKQERDKILGQANKTQGVERAKLLDKVLTDAAPKDDGTGFGVPLMTNETWVREVIQLDADNKAGLKAKYEQVVSDHQLKQRLAEAEELAKADKFDEAAAAVDKAMADCKPVGRTLQKALFTRAGLQFRAKDLDGTLATLRKAKDAAPESDAVPEIEGAIKQVQQMKDAVTH